MSSVLKHAAKVRIDTIRATSDKKRSAFAQHLTPPETARLAISMFSELNSDQQFIKCLDLGAGTGMLSIALYDRYRDHIDQMDAVEMDAVLATVYETEMSSAGIPHELTLGDALVDTPRKEYDRIILNPPYKKMAANDTRQPLLPCKASNLYSAFISVGLSRLAEDGELVAIVPRSWMNGDYFTSFRKYAFGAFSLDALHVYESRTEVFSDTNVLQETMLVRFSKRAQAERIKVSQSTGKKDEIEVQEYMHQDLIDPKSLVVRIAPECNGCDLETVSSVGLCPSTGKVVDFRCKDRISEVKPDGDDVYRLFYSGNFSDGRLNHPKSIGKAQWYVADDPKSIRQLTNPGSYVVVKRFSSKEERKRVAAYPLFLEEAVALENHLNFIHAGTPRQVVPLASKELALGLAMWLNSTFVDEWFRDVSGSTQVNAKDIKAMPCPSIDILEEIGVHWETDLTQSEVDEICKGMKWIKTTWSKRPESYS